MATEVETLMQSIREQASREERMANDEIPAFETIPVINAEVNAPEQAASGIQLDWPLLMSSLAYVNGNFSVPYYWDFGGGIKGFFKRVIRRLARCILLPIVENQNTLNAHIVRCLNQLRYHVECLLGENGLRVQDISQLKAENGLRIQDISQLREENGLRVQDISQLREENGLRVQDISQLREENSLRIQELSQLRTENALRIQDVEQLKTENAIRAQELEKLRRELEAQRAEVQDYAAAMQELLNRKLASLESKYEELEQFGASLEEKYAGVEQRSTSLEEKYAEVEQRSTSLEEQYGGLERSQKEHLRELQTDIERRLAADSERFLVQERTDQGLQQEIDALNRQSDAFSVSVAKAFLKLKNGEGALPKRELSEPNTPPHERTEPAAGENAYTAVDYFKFQNDFRGTRALIAQRQEIYLPYFKNCGKPVLDIGCGRGEFLQLLKNNHIPAYGVDLYPEYVAEGELNDLDVRQGDGVEYLKNSGETFGGIFVGQVIEHISFAQLQTLCFSAYEKLEEGGCLILETPNPTCLSTFTGPFFIDPTHVRPVHPLLLDYLLKQAGFRETKTVYTEASRVGKPLPLIEGEGIRNLDEVNAAIQKVSDLIFGSQDYAIIARK